MRYDRANFARAHCIRPCASIYFLQVRCAAKCRSARVRQVLQRGPQCCCRWRPACTPFTPSLPPPPWPTRRIPDHGPHPTVVSVAGAAGIVIPRLPGCLPSSTALASSHPLSPPPTGPAPVWQAHRPAVRALWMGLAGRSSSTWSITPSFVSMLVGHQLLRLRSGRRLDGHSGRPQQGLPPQPPPSRLQGAR